MKKAQVLVTHSTEAALIEWAHGINPKSNRPCLGEAASLALEEFARDRREFRAKFAAARQKVEKTLG